MKNYFKELLATLKDIERHLDKIAKCVKTNRQNHGDPTSISIKHWND